MKRNLVKKPTNGVELMAQVFMSICETAPRRKLERDERDFLVELLSGPYEGRAVRLCNRRDDGVDIEFHRSIGSACTTEHRQSSYFQLHVMFKSVQDASDILLGRLFEEVPIMAQGNLAFILPTRWNLFPVIEHFFALVQKLPKFHTWESEAEASWEKVKRKILAQDFAQGTVPA